MIYSSTVTTKGQATIPVEVRNFLGITPGQSVIFEKRDGEVFVKAAPNILELRGVFKTKNVGKKPLTNEESDDVIADAIVEDYVESINS